MIVKFRKGMFKSVYLNLAWMKIVESQVSQRLLSSASSSTEVSSRFRYHAYHPHPDPVNDCYQAYIDEAARHRMVDDTTNLSRAEQVSARIPCHVCQ